MTPAEVASIARSWIGTPFVPYGRSRAGCDCVGLVIGVMREANLVDESFCQKFTAYEGIPRRALVLREMKKRFERRAIAARGAVQIYREHVPLGGGWPALFAIGLDRAGSRIAVAHAKEGCVVEVPAPTYLLHSVWAMPGVTYELDRR